MYHTKIAGLGYYVPEKRVSNKDLAEVMDTSDEWIRERTGIQERRYCTRHEETTTTMAAEASLKAIDNAGIKKEDIEFIIFATLSPDYFFPGCGVLLQRELEITDTEIGALDIRNQCSGFIYGLSVADQFIRTGTYKNILLVGSEMHSTGLDYSDRGRHVTVIFGDGAGAVILQPSEDTDGPRILSHRLHSDGTYAEELAFINPGSHGGYHDKDFRRYGYEEAKYGKTFLTQKMMDSGDIFPHMNGSFVFKMAVQKFPEVINEVLNDAQCAADDIDLLIPHQANLRISQFVQRQMGLPDEKIYNNIQKYGNTTAASIPIALAEAVEEDMIKRGDIVCLAAFGSGFTWGAALIKY